MDKRKQFEALIIAANAILFDFDGLLVDSEKHHFRAYSEVFARYGHTIVEKEYYKYWTSLGLGPQGEIERYGLDLDPQEIIAEKKPIFSRYCRGGDITFFPEAKEFVECYRRLGKRLAIASATSGDDIMAVVENAGMEGYFEFAIGKESVERLKPAPDVFLKAAEMLGMDRKECLVLEDAEKGMRAAHEAGIPVIIVKSAQTRPFEFPLADLVFESSREMLLMLREFC